MLRKMHLLNTHEAVYLPALINVFGIFLLRQFFMSIPDEIGDAATVDGANPFDIYWRIYLPLSKPALTAYGVITALAAWNSYLWPLIVVQSKELRPLTLVRNWSVVCVPFSQSETWLCMLTDSEVESV